MIDALHDVLQKIEREWKSKRVLVVGDVMLDKYAWGNVGRISPEAPVPVVHATHTTYQPGGAGNVAMNLARLGAETQVIGFIGSDQDGEFLLEGLRANGISPNCLIAPDFPTVSKMRVIGGKQQMLRLDHECLTERPTRDQDRLIEAVLNGLPGSDAVILSDYAKGVLTAKTCQAIILAARKLQIPVIVDPKTADFARYRGATTICPNISELSRAVNSDPADLERLLSKAEPMLENLDFKFITATLSEKGIALIRRNRRFMDPAVARQVFDVSGAGDTVVAVLAMSLASKLEPEVGVQLANLAAGIVVGKVGTVPVERHELLAALTTELTLNAQDKVVSRDELAMRTSIWRLGGERVVFTNGCFDLLHVGHIAVIEQARRFGDRLVVAINSDSSISKLKGSNRPIVSQNERARVLAALGAVDAVVIFEETTPLDLILSIRPDVIVKGGDYTTDTVVGAREAEQWGGQVRIVPTLQGFSTTGLVQKLQRRAKRP